jgi:hypothetical protein
LKYNFGKARKLYIKNCKERHLSTEVTLTTAVDLINKCWNLQIYPIYQASIIDGFENAEILAKRHIKALHKVLDSLSSRSLPNSTELEEFTEEQVVYDREQAIYLISEDILAPEAIYTPPSTDPIYNVPIPPPGTPPTPEPSVPTANTPLTTTIPRTPITTTTITVVNPPAPSAAINAPLSGAVSSTSAPAAPSTANSQ